MAEQYLGPHEIWESHEMKQKVKDACAEWVDKAEWKYFITLTFAADKVDEDFAKNKLKYLFLLLNRRAFGNHHTKIVGRSYFSYFWAMEKQQRGAWHFHILVDRPIDFDFLHSKWHGWSGICDYGPVIDAKNAVKYVCKNAIDGNFDLFETNYPLSV